MVTVSVPGTHPEGENRTCKPLLAASVDQKRSLFFYEKRTNRVVLGRFGVLRWGFARDCGRYLFVLVAFILWVRFLDYFCCFCLC